MTNMKWFSAVSILLFCAKMSAGSVMTRDQSCSLNCTLLYLNYFLNVEFIGQFKQNWNIINYQIFFPNQSLQRDNTIFAHSCRALPRLTKTHIIIWVNLHNIRQICSINKMHCMCLCSSRVSASIPESGSPTRSWWLSFTNHSNHCLCVFTLQFCSLKPRQERISWALCLHWIFPVWERHCRQRPITRKHRTMADGGFAPKTKSDYLCWGNPSTTQRDINFVLHRYMHSEGKALAQTLSKWALAFPGEL